MRTYPGLLANAVRSALRSKHDLVLEHLALRQQLAVLTRRRARTRTKPAGRLFWSSLSSYWSGWRSTLVMVRPETVTRWHRTAWRAYWTWKSRARHSGRPRISKELQGLIARIATENPRWGAVRIQGEQLALGYEVSRRCEQLRLALLAFKDRYNRPWLVERHGHRTPAAVREALRSTTGVATDGSAHPTRARQRSPSSADGFRPRTGVTAHESALGRSAEAT